MASFAVAHLKLCIHLTIGPIVHLHPPPPTSTQRNTMLLNSIYNAKTTFKVVSPATAPGSATHKNLVAKMSEYCKNVENLYPSWTATLSNQNVDEIQRLEEERR